MKPFEAPEPPAARPARGRRWPPGLVAACLLAEVLLLIATFQLGNWLSPVREAHAAGFDSRAAEASRFALNWLLVPAVATEEGPLRWVDPRPRARCGAGTQVLVDGEPLAAGAPVPDRPFELEWFAQGCRPAGRAGPSLDGRVRLTVYRENWGFSAAVEPFGLVARYADGTSVNWRRSVAAMPRQGPADEEPLLF